MASDVISEAIFFSIGASWGDAPSFIIEGFQPYSFLI
jgi:hypothetical protein